MGKIRVGLEFMIFARILAKLTSVEEITADKPGKTNIDSTLIILIC